MHDKLSSLDQKIKALEAAKKKVEADMAQKLAKKITAHLSKHIKATHPHHATLHSHSFVLGALDEALQASIKNPEKIDALILRGDKILTLKNTPRKK